MRIIPVCILAVVVCIAFTACEQPQGKKYTYKCGDGTHLEIIIPEDGATATLRYDGRYHKLERVESGSGMKYADDEYEFRSKGNTAFLKIKGEVVHDGCVLVD
jgi:membrane-bound inhibitor of C-type lysozyme